MAEKKFSSDPIGDLASLSYEDFRRSSGPILSYNRQSPSGYSKKELDEAIKTALGGMPKSDKINIDTNINENYHIYGVASEIRTELDRLNYGTKFTLTLNISDYDMFSNKIKLPSSMPKYAYITLSNTPIDKVELPVTIETGIMIEEYDMKKIALMQDKEKDWFKFYCPYDKEAIELIKSKIPINMRQPIYGDMVYKNTGRRMFECWRIHKTYMNEVVEIINKYWSNQTVDSDLVEAVGDGKTDWIGKIFEACPKDNMSRLYKALASVYHPDVGGDSATMSRINVEYHRRINNGQTNTGKP